MWPGLGFSVLLVLLALTAALIARRRGSRGLGRAAGARPTPPKQASVPIAAVPLPSAEDRAACVALADEVVASVPRRTTWRAFTAPLVPPPGRGASGLCSRCGRALPAFSSPRTTSGQWYNNVDRSQRCLVDGLRAHHARALSSSSIAVAAQRVAGGLGERG